MMRLFKRCGKSKVEISAYRPFATPVEVKEWAEISYDPIFSYFVPF